VIRIAISVEAFDAIAATLATLPKGIVGVEPERQLSAGGKRLIRLGRAVVDRLRFLRGPGESYSDAILRLASEARR
jgi:hypothetical protein